MHIELKNAKDIRDIYDELLNEEIAENDLLDGNVFRKNSVSVFKRDGKGSLIHNGVMPEKNIIANIDMLLNFINDSKETSDLIKIAVAHYYFGYIHPFYDGNGRINRFISLYLISKSANDILALK